MICFSKYLFRENGRGESKFSKLSSSSRVCPTLHLSHSEYELTSRRPLYISKRKGSTIYTRRDEHVYLFAIQRYSK
jgi:hypothetical protein